jgi:hypothetical protein
MPPAIKSPTPTELTKVLGTMAALWPGIVRTVEGVAAPLELTWKPAKTAFGRYAVLQHKKRTLLYLIPEAGELRVGIVLGERAYGLAMASDLPVAIKELFAEAKPYVEGRGIRFPVRTAKDLPVIRKLVQIKTTPK